MCAVGWSEVEAIDMRLDPPRMFIGYCQSNHASGPTSPPADWSLTLEEYPSLPNQRGKAFLLRTAPPSIADLWFTLSTIDSTAVLCLTSPAIDYVERELSLAMKL